MGRVDLDHIAGLDHLLEAADKAVEGIVDVAGVAKLHEDTAAELGIKIETIND